MGWVGRHGWRHCLELRKVNVYPYLLCCCRVTQPSWCGFLGDVSQKYVFAFKEAELYIIVISVFGNKMVQGEILGQPEEGCRQGTVREAQPPHRGPQVGRCRFPPGKEHAWGPVTPEMLPGDADVKGAVNHRAVTGSNF